MALSEAKTIARKEFEKALESTGKDLDSIKDFVTSHPELTKALYPIPHRHGVVGVAETDDILGPGGETVRQGVRGDLFNGERAFGVLDDVDLRPYAL